MIYRSSLEDSSFEKLEGSTISFEQLSFKQSFDTIIFQHTICCPSQTGGWLTWSTYNTKQDIVYIVTEYRQSTDTSAPTDVRNFRQLSHLFPSSLAHLLIFNFEKLESLSMGLQHLTSLQHLSFWSCPKIKNLPKQLMPSLLSLKIYGCPDLRKRCEGRGSHYYPLISHIPQIRILRD
ncbi:putative leucine-rich repeat domain superfamily [Helianthus annuus]|nr:putative leucine-rich repeat domain superfamily [Helianthus annuus]